MKKSIRGVTISDQSRVISNAPTILPLPERVVLDLVVPWGEASPMVKKGEAVKRGQCIAKSGDPRVPPVHASISGTVEDIKPWTGYLGKDVLSVVIRSDGEDESIPPPEQEASEDPLEILERIAAAGIREVDPHPWPLPVRIAQPDLVTDLIPTLEASLAQPIETLIINGMDRQPGVSLRSFVVPESQSKLLQGIPLLQKVSAAKRTVLTTTGGQALPDAFLQRLKELGVEVLVCPDKFPLALEPLLVQFITGKEVPQPSGDTRAVGAVVVDAVTAIRIAKAVGKGIPPTETLVHVAIPRQKMNQIVQVRIGTLVEDVLRHLLPDFPKETAKVILGGPFLGYAQHNFRIPLTQQTDSLILQHKKDLISYKDMPCINCGNCVSLCPMRLYPHELGRYCEYGLFEEAEKVQLFHCIECGICAYVCPSRRPMVQLIRLGKQELQAVRKES